SYKAHRVAEDVATGPDVEVVPDPLEAQVPIIRETLAALGIAIVGAPEHEADDVIGTLASTADMPVDVVTGDRDLFQVIDDERAVRVVYTGRGMARLDVLDDAAVLARYGVHAAQYADLAALRGDPSDGLPGVAGIGEKSAARLLTQYGDLAGIRTAAADASTAMTASVRAKLIAAADYLDAAPTVVNVVRDLALPPFDARLRPPDVAQQEERARLAAEHGIGTALDRAAKALGAVTG
ncbi:MAG: 5'-3' exonuclease H3TH domain-containing protein, partial [Microbacterium sp.]